MKKAVRRTLSATVAAAMAIGLMTGCSSGKEGQKPAGGGFRDRGTGSWFRAAGRNRGRADHHQILGWKLAGSRVARGGGNLEQGASRHQGGG